MPLRTRLLLVGLLALLVVIMVVWFSPVAVSNGLRLWIWWKGRQEGLTVSIDKIYAPFLRPAVIRGLHMTNTRADAFHIDFTATSATLDLNLIRILLYRRGYAIRTLSIEGLHGEIRRDNPAVQGLTRPAWQTLHKLLPRKFSLHSSQIRVQDGPTLILLRNCDLSASDIEAGRFSAGEVMIASPWVRQTFSQLRGATRWETDRLILAGLTLAHGLDLESISVDLSRLGSQRVGLEFDADAFGGRIRGNISHEWHSPRQNWKVAGGATDISLVQTSEAIGLTDHFGGLLRACNFTFRGNLNAPAEVTASLWTEMTGLTWRGRTAEAIMLGASLYNQQIQLQQVYIKQKTNQLTLSGQASFSSKSSEWLSPDFGGDISATINNLGDFTSLFGANSGNFSGKLMVKGTLTTRARRLAGNLTIEGASLTLFKTAIDSLSAKLKLEGTQLAIEQFDLKHKNDYLNAQGKIDMSGEHNYGGTVNAAIDDLTPYLAAVEINPIQTKPASVNAHITIDSGVWDGSVLTQIPNSAPIALSVHFPLRIGDGWNAFGTSSVLSLSFPLVSLADAQRYLNLGIFRDGILSGGMHISGTLLRPDFLVDVQLVNGQLENASLGLTELSGHVYFGADHGVVAGMIDFLRASTKDVDLSFTGDIAGPDLSDVRITVTGTSPVFDLTPRQIDCASRIDLVPTGGMILAPLIDKMEVRGGLFGPRWTLTLQPVGRLPAIEAIDIAMRSFPLCLGALSDGKTLTLGAYSRPQPSPVRARRKAKTR